MLAPTLTFKLGECSLGKAFQALPPHSLLSSFREWLESERCFSMRFLLNIFDAFSNISKLSTSLRVCIFGLFIFLFIFVKILNIVL